MSVQRFLADALEKSTVPGPFDNKNPRYEPSNPEKISKTPEQYYQVSSNQQLDSFLLEIDTYRDDVRQTGEQIDEKVGKRTLLSKIAEKGTEIGAPILAGQAAKSIISDSLGPISAGVTGVIAGGTTALMRTRNIDTDTGEGLNEFVQKHYIGIDRNIEKRTGVRGFLSKVSKGLNYLEYRAAGEGINLGFTRLGGSRVKERASRIESASKSLKIDISSDDLFTEVTEFLKNNEKNEKSLEELQSLVTDMYIQSRVSGFSETHDPDEMSKKVKAMATISYALVSADKREIVDAAYAQSMIEVQRISKSVKRSYVISSAVNRGLKGLAMYNTFETVSKFFTPEVIETTEFDQLQESIVGNNSDLITMQERLDILSGQKEDLISKLPSAEDLDSYRSEITSLTSELDILNTESIDVSKLSKLEFSYDSLPTWLNNQEPELYFDPNGLELQTAEGLSFRDSFGAIYNKSGEVVGVLRNNDFGTNSNGEQILDFFENGPLQDGMSTSIKTYPVGLDLSSATDATEINLSLNGSDLYLSNVNGTELLDNPINIDIPMLDNSEEISKITSEIENINNILNGASELETQIGGIEDEIDLLLTTIDNIENNNEIILQELIKLSSDLTPDLKQYVDDFFIGTYALLSALDASDNSVMYGNRYNSSKASLSEVINTPLTPISNQPDSLNISATNTNQVGSPIVPTINSTELDFSPLSLENDTFDIRIYKLIRYLPTSKVEGMPLLTTNYISPLLESSTLSESTPALGSGNALPLVESTDSPELLTIMGSRAISNSSNQYIINTLQNNNNRFTSSLVLNMYVHEIVNLRNKGIEISREQFQDVLNEFKTLIVNKAEEKGFTNVNADDLLYGNELSTAELRDAVIQSFNQAIS